MLGVCVACGVYGVQDRAHVKSRKSGGTWDDFNIILLCRKHHVESHNIGWVKFVSKFPNVELELNKKGWVIESLFGRVRLIRNEG